MVTSIGRIFGANATKKYLRLNLLISTNKKPIDRIANIKPYKISKVNLLLTWSNK